MDGVSGPGSKRGYCNPECANLANDWCADCWRTAPTAGIDFVRPSEAEEQRALRWLMDVRWNGGPLERRYAASVIATLAWFEARDNDPFAAHPVDEVAARRSRAAHSQSVPS